MAKSKKIVKSAPSVVEVAKILSQAKEAKYNLANLFVRRSEQTGKSAYLSAIKALKDVWTLLFYVRAMMELDPKAMAGAVAEITKYANENHIDLGDMEMELVSREIRLGIGYMAKRCKPAEEAQPAETQVQPEEGQF